MEEDADDESKNPAAQGFAILNEDSRRVDDAEGAAG